MALRETGLRRPWPASQSNRGYDNNFAGGGRCNVKVMAKCEKSFCSARLAFDGDGGSSVAPRHNLLKIIAYLLRIRDYQIWRFSLFLRI